MKIAIIKYTESTGREYIVGVTNDVDKWLEDHNSYREKEDHESLLTFNIEWTHLHNYDKKPIDFLQNELNTYVMRILGDIREHDPNLSLKAVEDLDNHLEYFWDYVADLQSEVTTYLLDSVNNQLKQYKKL